MTHTRNHGPVIRTQGLTKTFTRHKQTVEAVKGLDLEVADGELVAVLGPNGAGKSTTLRMLTTLVAPTSGTAEVAGFDVVREQRAVRRSIGYVGQGNAAGHQQRGRDEVVSQARAHGLSRAEAHARAEELLAAFDLSEHAGRPVSTLSGGQRRRLDVAIGLVHQPRLMFLDEPSTGLDPQNRVNLQEQVQRLNREQILALGLGDPAQHLECRPFPRRAPPMQHPVVEALHDAADLTRNLAQRLAEPAGIRRIVAKRSHGCGDPHPPRASLSTGLR